ncbi:MAG: hypothetical protein AVDCRST_MAG15-1289, partial [uncultured Rubellimicrobium sp.]
ARRRWPPRCFRPRNATRRPRFAVASPCPRGASASAFSGRRSAAVG